MSNAAEERELADPDVSSGFPKLGKAEASPGQLQLSLQLEQEQREKKNLKKRKKRERESHGESGPAQKLLGSCQPALKWSHWAGTQLGPDLSDGVFSP